MTVRMLVNATAPGELRIAIVEDGELIELDIEAAEKSSLRHNIYKGVVHNVEGSLEAAFVDIGAHKQGFLPFSEVAESQYSKKPSGSGEPRITDVIRRGQDIVVQVGKDAVGDKGATLTTFLSLPGRYTVLMPGGEANGISRKIDDEKTRKRIRSMVAKIKKPEGCGFIVRTAGLNQTRIGIQRDLDKVVAQWEKLCKAAEIARAPSILHAEPDLVGRTLRDFFTEDIDEVMIDSEEEYNAAVEYFREVMPEYEGRVTFYENPIPIFAYHRVEEQIEATFCRRVPLPSGGSIVIDETEALVAIDVNSGKMTSEGDHEGTVSKTNIEAAEEIARQLRLRDLGGIVVVDFIDMEQSKNKRAVEKALAEASTDDKARWKISRINSKGLCVFTRQRIRQGMRKAFQVHCSACSGTGWVRTPESHSLSLLRRLETRLAQGGVGEARLKTHRETAEFLQNFRRAEMLAMERQYRCRVIVMAHPDMERAHDDVTFLSKGEILAEMTDRLPAREERKRERDRRRRKRRRKNKATTAAPFRVAEEKPARRKKKRAQNGTNGVADGERAADPPGLEAKGNTTFTGRPSPEMLKKLKAERAARRSRVASRKVANSGSSGALCRTEPGDVKPSVQAVSKPRAMDAVPSSEPGAPAAGRASPRLGARRPRRGIKKEGGSAKPVAFSGTVGKGQSRIPPPEGSEDADARVRKSLLERIFGSG